MMAATNTINPYIARGCYRRRLRDFRRPEPDLKDNVRQAAIKLLPKT